MTALPVLLYPHAVLSRKDNGLLTPDHPQLAHVLRDLADTLEASPGVALAAPQIGYSLQAIVVDVTRDNRPERRTGHGRVFLLNPRITETGQPKRIREGCLSVPDYTGNVVRFQKVTVEGMTPTWERMRLECVGYEAVAFQHEIDHIEGRLFLDRVTSPHVDLFQRRVGPSV